MVRREEQKENGLKESECLTILGIPQSTHSGWKRNREAAKERVKKEYEKLTLDAERFKAIIRILSYVPGKRTFKAVYEWKFHEKISVKRCAKVRDFMGLVSYRPKKDAYKNQARHNHECLAPANLVEQEFRIWPRTVILTDITYFYYGSNRRPFYLCTFMDAYTREILGCEINFEMKTETLVKPAYQMMMEKHKNEMDRAECVVHSDQGSQYLSAEFRELLKDDKVLQSVSKRGCCYDNAPQESFFGHLKTKLLDTVAMAQDYGTARELIMNYITEYNTKNIQYSLGGLTPEDYYTYTVTGIYPIEKYFGVDASRLMNPLQLKKLRDERRKRENDYRNKAERRKKDREAATAGQLKAAGPIGIVMRDKRMVERLLKEVSEKAEKYLQEKKKYAELLEGINRAMDYLTGLDEEVRKIFMSRDAWKGHEELRYIEAMDRMFA